MVVFLYVRVRFTSIYCYDNEVAYIDEHIKACLLTIMAYMMFLDRQFMSELIFHIFPFLNVIDSPVIMSVHVPHLGSLHFVTVVAFEGVDENLALVKGCFKFLGCLRLTINLVSSMIAFIFVDEVEVFFYFAYDLWIVWVVCYYNW